MYRACTGWLCTRWWWGGTRWYGVLGTVRTLVGTRGMGPGVLNTTVLPVFGPIWPQYHCFACIWPYLALFPAVLALFGPISCCFGPISCCFGPIWLFLALFGCFRSQWWPDRGPSGGQIEVLVVAGQRSLVVPDLGLVPGGFDGLGIHVHCVCRFVISAKRRFIRKRPSGPK